MLAEYCLGIVESTLSRLDNDVNSLKIILKGRGVGQKPPLRCSRKYPYLPQVTTLSPVNVRDKNLLTTKGTHRSETTSKLNPATAISPIGYCYMSKPM